jgi:S1-C subfamily serine protease
MKMVKSVRLSGMLLTAGLAAALTTAAPVAFAQAPKPISVAPPAGAPMSFAELIDRVSPAVVSVVVTTEVKTSKLEKQFNPFRGLPGFDAKMKVASRSRTRKAARSDRVSSFRRPATSSPTITLLKTPVR